ncbi:MAG: hypothetical protein ACK587_08595 [Cyanobacteriota bacterium]
MPEPNHFRVHWTICPISWLCTRTVAASSCRGSGCLVFHGA